MKLGRWQGITLFLVTVTLAGAGAGARGAFGGRYDDDEPQGRRRARNVIFFVGDGMGVSTVTATRIFSVGVAGQLVVDQFPYTALSKTYSADSITPDSAPTMTAMMSGVNTNQSVIGLDKSTEPNDFNHDGDGQAPWTLLEEAKARGMKVGVVSTARITHATPAATFAHINQRDNENAIALQALRSDATYNRRLERGIDVLMGGGRQFFVPTTVVDEEGGAGSRTDGRDLRAEFATAGYTYVWDQAGFDALTPASLPVLGLFERGHMEYEVDRPTDLGGEPGIAEMTTKSIRLLERATRRGSDGYFLMVEGGRIDHAHHEGNAYRALTDAEAFDEAIGAAAQIVDLRETLIIVSADHSHVFNIAGYPLRPLQELPYKIQSSVPEYADTGTHGHGLLDLVYDVNQSTGHVSESTDRDGIPYTVLGYLNGPGYRGTPRQDPRTDVTPGRNGEIPSGPWHQTYFQEAAVPLGSETHAGEDVAIYAIGPGSERVHGTVKNAQIYHVMKRALGLR
ncbi:MAG: alkaline phosphatase [Luteitalea sp.]|nr:alkaline phosphatase [Luteitalea sp.]